MISTDYKKLSLVSFRSSFDIYKEVLSKGTALQISYVDGTYININETQYPESYDPRKQNWYLNAIVEKDNIIWFGPYFDYLTQNIIITAARALYDKDDNVLGVVSVNFNEAEISNKISNAAIGTQGYIMLLSDKGSVLANTDNSLIGYSIFNMNTIKNKSDELNNLKIKDGLYNLKYDTLQTNGMMVATAASISEIKDNCYKSLVPALVTEAFTIIVILLITYYLTLKIINPIEALSKLMSKAEYGDYDVTAKIENYYEIKSLSESFNTMISAIKKRDEKINHLAYYDYLTGLPNRTSLLEMLSDELVILSESGGGAILFLDIDNFKNINDTMGHTIGDIILIETAHRLKNIDQTGLYVARFGGDEFILVAQDYGDYSLAASLCKGVLNNFEKPITIDKRNFDISTSIGVSFYPNHGNSPDDLLKKADLAMYKAKEKGKNCYQIFDESLQTEMLIKQNIESGLRHAIKRNEFTLVYQPLFNLKENRILCLEALLRWNSNEFGPVSTLSLIKTAEKTGQIIKIEKWVINESFIFAKLLNENKPEQVKISINISPVHIMHRDFIFDIINTIKEIGIKPCLICLEITENAFIESFNLCKSKLEALKDYGFEIHLDDFGTGYSSLNYLKELPIDGIKIDKTFIDPITQSIQDERITSTIINLAHNIGLKVIAEGVEDKEQYDILSSFGCDFIQGYYISRPIPSDEVLTLL